MVKIPKHFGNLIGLLIGLILSFIGLWQTSMVAWWASPHTIAFFIPLILMMIGFFYALYKLWDWDYDQSFFDNVYGFILGISMALSGSMIWDFHVAPYVNQVWDKWIFYIPLGFQNGLPVWQWNGTALLWGTAYVVFFLIMWIGFIISWMSIWFWED